MRTIKLCGHLGAASLIAWLLLMPPFAIAPGGKTFVDTQASLPKWEVFSRHATDTECRKHRDALRAQLEKATESQIDAGADSGKTAQKTASKASDKPKQVFATLKQRAAAARCVASNDPRLVAPIPSPTK
jgi:hypothetical protein